MFPNRIWFKTIFLVCCLFSVDFGQSNRANAQIYGTVLGPGERVVPGVSVTLINLTDQTVLHTAANREGVFAFEDVKSGIYELSAEAEWAYLYVKRISVKDKGDIELNVKLRSLQCPDPIKRLSEEEKTTSRSCAVHHKSLKIGIVPIKYGLFLLSPNGVGKEFPNSNLIFQAGCLVDCYEKAEVLFCPSCRREERKWKRENKSDNNYPIVPR